MKINVNMAAIQTLNSLGKANNSAAKAMERLSSGLRINSAADDAAGLAIANKMNAQVKGLDQANRNAMDGISMIQTAEGALDEVHAMLQRMRQLTVQAANGTYGEVDKETVMNEIDQLMQEMEAIEGRSEFNTMNLLDGSNSRFTLQVGANKDQSMVVSGDGMDLTSVLVNLTGINISEVISGMDSSTQYTIPAESTVAVDGIVVNLKDKGIELKPGSVVSIQLGVSQDFEVKRGIDTYPAPVNKGEKIIFKVDPNSTGGTLEKMNGAGEVKFTWDGDPVMTTAKSGSLGSLSKRLVNFDSTTDTDNALKRIDAAISQTSIIRSRLGAYQNRLEHTVTNLETSEENMTASMSRIQDADMAEEMTNYTQYNVIAQAATAMLAQANQRPQQVLQLLHS